MSARTSETDDRTRRIRYALRVGAYLPPLQVVYVPRTDVQVVVADLAHTSRELEATQAEVRALRDEVARLRAEREALRRCMVPPGETLH